MKKNLLLLLFLLFPIIANAQRFGDTEDQISSGMSNDKTYKFVDKKINKKGNLSITYSSDLSVKTFILDSAKKCYIITILYPIKDLPTVVKINNNMENNIKVGEMEWYSTVSNIKSRIIVYKEEKLFQLVLTEN